LRVNTRGGSTSIIKGNAKFIAVPWDTTGGGALAIIPIKQKGRMRESPPLLRVRSPLSSLFLSAILKQF
jgi:coronin-1B/1C/6